MKKKILLVLCLLSALLVLTLASCASGGPAVSDSAGMSVKYLDDGSGIQVTINYVDDMEDPSVFVIPMSLDEFKGDKGEQGEKGEQGFSIQEILVDSSVEGQKTLTPILEDGTEKGKALESFIVKDGVSILSVTRVDLDDGPYLRITFSEKDAETGEYVYVDRPLPKGDKGDKGIGIDPTSFTYSTNPDSGVTKVTFKLDDPDGTPVEFYVNPGKDGVGLTGEVLTEDWIDEETDRVIGTILKFVLDTDPTTTTGEVRIKNGVGFTGEVKIEELTDENGKRTGQEIQFYKTDGTLSDIIQVMDGLDGSFIEDIASEHLEGGITRVTVTLSDGTTKTFDIKGVSKVDQKTDEDGNIILIFKDAEGKTISEVLIKKPKEVVDIVATDDGTNYVITITYSDAPNSPITYTLAKPNSWHQGEDTPGNDFGNAGDYFFDKTNAVIYHKRWNELKQKYTWEEIIDFYDFNNPSTIYFYIDPALGEKWDPDSIFAECGTYYDETRLHIGQSYSSYGTQYAIPVPQREGYRFLGWYTTRTPNATNAPFTDLTVVSATELKLYPVWEKIS